MYQLLYRRFGDGTFAGPETERHQGLGGPWSGSQQERGRVLSSQFHPPSLEG